jgi:hypothetical protein
MTMITSFQILSNSSFVCHLPSDTYSLDTEGTSLNNQQQMIYPGHTIYASFHRSNDVAQNLYTNISSLWSTLWIEPTQWLSHVRHSVSAVVVSCAAPPRPSDMHVTTQPWFCSQQKATQHICSSIHVPTLGLSAPTCAYISTCTHAAEGCLKGYCTKTIVLITRRPFTLGLVHHEKYGIKWITIPPAALSVM